MSLPQKAFDTLSEKSERFLSLWWGVLLYFVGIGFCGYLWGWDGSDRYIYVTSAALFILLIGSNRRSAKAEQAKLDKITPDDSLNKVEEREEKEIDKLREAQQQ